jgi:hypothetical protein
LFTSALVCSLVFLSCIGAGSNIRINGDGSGVIKLEYRIAQALEDMGKLDGNERWLPVPVGRADLERTVERIEGLKILSYSAAKSGADTLHSAELSFSNPGALSSFLDSSGRFFQADFSARRIRLVFPAMEKMDGEFREMLGGALQGYDFSLSLTLPGTVSVSWSGEGGDAYPGTCSVNGPALDYSAPMADLVFLESALTMEISW